MASQEQPTGRAELLRDPRATRLGTVYLLYLSA
jgi:hypothetical protein